MTDNAGLVERLRACVVYDGDENAPSEAAAALTAAEAEIAGLRRERDEALANHAQCTILWEADRGRAETTLAQTRAMLAEAVGALEPFAQVPKNGARSSGNDDASVAWGFDGYEITVGAFRRARSIHDKIKEATDGR